MPSRSGAPRLLTLAASHYCEKARWGLERAGIAYEEECHVPGLHRAIVARHRAGVTVPILLTGDLRIGGSAAILHHVDTLAPPELRLYPEDPATRAEVEALERRFDDVLGPATRLIAYWHVLRHPGLLSVLMDHDLPPGEHFVLNRFAPAVNFTIRKALGVTDAGYERARASVEQVFAEVVARVGDGRPYLTGERFTAADLAFATLTAPLVWPAHYGSGMLTIADAPPPVREAIEEQRATPGGALAVRLFEQERAHTAANVAA